MHVRVRVPPRTAKRAKFPPEESYVSPRRELRFPPNRAKFPPKRATFPREESYVSPRRELSFPPIYFILFYFILFYFRNSSSKNVDLI